MKAAKVDTHTGKEPLEDKVIFAPLEEIKSIELVIDNMEITYRELQKVMEGMKLIAN